MQRYGRLAQKVALVIGGNGDIGGAIAEGFAAEGATVIPSGRDITRIKKSIRKLTGFKNSWQEALPCDVTNPESIETLRAAVLKKYKRIDILVCAQGVYHNGAAEEHTREEWERVLAVNLTGTFSLCSLIGKEMLKKKKGSIITIGSLGAFVAMSRTIAYSVSKAGVVSLTKCFAAEWAERGVRVNAIIPGVFPTRLNKKALAMPGRVENILRGIPQKRLGKLDELVGAAVYLASDESRYVTGISLPVDGGFLSYSGY